VDVLLLDFECYWVFGVVDEVLVEVLVDDEVGFWFYCGGYECCEILFWDVFYCKFVLD